MSNALGSRVLGIRLRVLSVGLKDSDLELRVQCSGKSFRRRLNDNSHGTKMFDNDYHTHNDHGKCVWQ